MRSVIFGEAVYTRVKYGGKACLLRIPDIRMAVVAYVDIFLIAVDFFYFLI